MTTGYPLAKQYDDEEMAFNESPVIRMYTYDVVNTGTLDTSEFDQYRQGIELTLDKYYQLGTVKIHSGEPERGHRIKQTSFGMDALTPYSEQKIFQEVDYFDPIEYIQAQATATSFEDFISRMTYPIILPDVDQAESYSSNGIMEPFVIRQKITMNSIESPFFSHDVSGELQAGNIDHKRSSDLILSVAAFEPERAIIPYTDSCAMLNGHTQVGIFSWETPINGPFKEIYYYRGIKISQQSSHIQPQIEALSPSTEDYVPSGSISAACGFVYDAITGIGTDSLAFGGLTNEFGNNPYRL